MTGAEPREDGSRTGPRPLVWLIFLGGMVFSAALSLWFGRNVTFTGDELAMLSLVAELQPGELFEPYVGHLVPVAFLAYKALLETVGTSNYYFFQMMALGSIFLMGAGVLYWGSRRVPDWVALAPSLVLILFTGDLLHYVAGNGFTIIFALACGVWALNAWERDTRWGDVAALVLLAIGMMTYTVGVAFAVGLVVAALVGDRRRVWVAGAPLLAYALWRVLVASSSAEVEDVGPDWVNIFLLPAWSFQAIGGVLESLVGVGFNFNIKEGLDESIFTGNLAPVLAVVFLGLILWRLREGGIPKTFWTVAAIAVAMFTSQVLVWGSFEARAEPLEPRYLYPGALVVILMGIELVRGVEWDRIKLAILWLATAVAIASAIGALINSVVRFEVGTNMSRAQATAAYILQTTPNPPPVSEQARSTIRRSFDPVATRGFPSFSFDESKLDEIEPRYSKEVDSFLAESLQLGLKPIEPGVATGPCRPAVAGPGPSGRATVPSGGAILESARDLELRLGRYGRNASWPLGPLWADRPAQLFIPTDAGTRPWFVQVDASSAGELRDLVICRPPRD